MDVGSDTRSAHVHGDVMEKEKPLDDDETTDEMRDVRRRLLVNQSLNFDVYDDQYVSWARKVLWRLFFSTLMPYVFGCV